MPAPAPQAAPTKPQPAPPSEEEREEEAKRNVCAIRDVCFGPVLTLGLVNVLGVGAQLRYRQHFGVGLDYQWFPSVTISGTSAGWSLFTLEGRWYPFGGAFFLAGGFGYQSFSASVSQTSMGVDMSMKGTLGIPAFKLGIGVMGHDGFVLGIDLGLNIPLGGTSVDFEMPGTTSDPAQIVEMRKQINDAANKGVKLIPVLPQLNLLRIGYLF